jgi:hypothetical protein
MAELAFRQHTKFGEKLGRDNYTFHIQGLHNKVRISVLDKLSDSIFLFTGNIVDSSYFTVGLTDQAVAVCCEFSLCAVKPETKDTRVQSNSCQLPPPLTT